jgi:hypothetical protein
MFFDAEGADVPCVDFATVYSETDVRFTFMNGVEILA